MATTTLNRLHWQNNLSWKFFLKKTLAKLPPTTVGLELLSNLRNLCGVWHAIGYSGRCGQDEELLKGCQINVPFESTWGTRIVTFLHLGWRWYIAWYSFWLGDVLMVDNCQDGPFASDDMAVSDACLHVYRVYRLECLGIMDHYSNECDHGF